MARLQMNVRHVSTAYISIEDVGLHRKCGWCMFVWIIVHIRNLCVGCFEEWCFLVKGVKTWRGCSAMKRSCNLAQTQKTVTLSPPGTQGPGLAMYPVYLQFTYMTYINIQCHQIVPNCFSKLFHDLRKKTFLPAVWWWLIHYLDQLFLQSKEQQMTSN